MEWQVSSMLNFLRACSISFCTQKRPLTLRRGVMRASTGYCRPSTSKVTTICEEAADHHYTLDNPHSAPISLQEIRRCTGGSTPRIRPPSTITSCARLQVDFRSQCSDIRDCDADAHWRTCSGNIVQVNLATQRSKACREPFIVTRTQLERIGELGQLCCTPPSTEMQQKTVQSGSAVNACTGVTWTTCTNGSAPEKTFIQTSTIIVL